MKERMKILIGYDGSEPADAALDELRRAGLPGEAEVLVISVAELWFAPAQSGEATPSRGERLDIISLKEAREQGRQVLEKMEVMASQAFERIKAGFPDWHILTEACADSPASAIVRRADEWGADLIVVGSHGRSSLGRLALGSISQKVATEAHCSVRIGRGRVLESIRPVRVLIGVDGSPGAQSAVRAVAARPWPAKTEVRLITLTGGYYNVIGAEASDATEQAREIQRKPEIELRQAGLDVSLKVDTGDPRQAIVEEARSWGADSIFVGARGLSKIKRFLLGSVSAAVAARAHCSVEIVRR
ncbi:MAG TPA: universal stress protein [Blastocatellia bacterium]|nr:universal stress protein [Blastocatellia bacterium]